MNSIKEISVALNKMNKNEIFEFINELFTPSEISTLSKRWRILKMLNADCTQREVAKELSVSLCKVTRGAKILKSDTITKRVISKGGKNGSKRSKIN